ncbi:MAG: VOC family protein [Candidatus Saccharibacteria bacterium]|nr:VOC family protein [Candidatus Saccharibacteria bacterium]
MKVTAFNPALVTNNPDESIGFFKKLGFKIIKKLTFDSVNDIEYILENESGQRMDIVYDEKIQKNMNVCRINVDDFDEAVNIFSEHGFKFIIEPLVTKTSKVVAFETPNHYIIFILQEF